MAAKVIPVWVVAAVAGGMTVLSVGASYLLRPRQKLGENKPNEYMTNIVDTDAFVPIAFGHCVVPTLLVFMDTNPDDINSLHGVAALCMGEIEEIQAVHFDNMESVAKLSDGTWEFREKYEGLIRFSRRKGTAADATAARRYEEVTKLFKKWTSKHLSAGIASMYMKMTYDQEKLSTIPAVYVRGKWQIVLDVRDSTYKYSNNSALCILHYLLDPIHGKGADLATEIIKDSFIAEANCCDEKIEYEKVEPPEKITTIYLIEKEKDNPFTSGATYYFKYAWGRGTAIVTEDDTYTAETSDLSAVGSAVAASDYGRFKLTGIDAPAGGDNVTLKTVYMATSSGGTYYEVADMDPESTNLNVQTTKVGGAHSASGSVNTPGSGCAVAFEDWSGSGLDASSYYRYKQSFVTADGETAPSPASKKIKTKSNQKAIKIKLAETDDSNVTHVRLYRTYGYANGVADKVNSDYYKVADIAIGTKYYTDLIADGSLAGVNPQASTTTLHSYIPRFTCNGLLDTGNDQDDNLDRLLSSCRGRLYNEGGKYRLFIPKITVPETFELTEDNIVGDWEFTIKGMSTKPNVVKASFINPYAEWKSDTVVWPKKDADNFYLKDDNGFKKVLDLDLPFTTNKKMAKTICQVRRKEARNNIIAEVTAMPSARVLRGGSLVRVTHPTPGWTQKKFWVDGVGIFPNGNVRLVLLEYTEDDYNYETLEEDTLPGTDTDLGDPTDAPDEVSGVSIAEEKYYKKDTSHWRLKVTYTDPVSAFWTHSEVWVRVGEGDEDTYQYITRIDKLSDGVFYLEQLKEFVKYHIKILSVSTLNAKTPLDEATEYTHTTSNVANPPDVTAFNAVVKDDVVTLVWEHITEADGSIVKDFNLYQIREGSSWANSTFIGNTKATNFIIKGATNGTHTYRIKAIDTAGNFSANDISVEAVVTDGSSWSDRITGNFTTGTHDGTERFDSGGGVYALRVQQNMISNGSFETDTTGWTLGGGWARSSAKAYLGSYSLATPGAGSSGFSSIIGADFTMEANANTQYIFAAWVWCNTPSCARLEMEINTGGIIAVSPWHSGNGTWELLYCKQTIGGTPYVSKYVRLRKQTAAGQAYFDDCRYGRVACTYTSTSYDRGSSKTQKGLLSFTGATSGSPVGYMTALVGISDDDSAYTWYPGLDFSEVITTGRYVKYRVNFSTSFPSQVLYMKEPVVYKETDPYIVPAKLGSGTPDGTKFLRDDNSWQAPPGGGTGGWTEVAGDDKIYTSVLTRKVGIGVTTPVAQLHLEGAQYITQKLAIGRDPNDVVDAQYILVTNPLYQALTIAEYTAGYSGEDRWNRVFQVGSTGVGNERLYLKVIDDMNSPVLGIHTAGAGVTAPLVAFMPYSGTVGLPFMNMRMVAGQVGPFMQFGDSNFVMPPAAQPPYEQVVSGTRGARTYYLAYTYKTATGETTACSTTAAISMDANKLIKVTIPKSFDPTVTNAYIYIGNTTTLYYQGSVAVSTANEVYWTEPDSALLTATAKPTTNTTGTMLMQISSPYVSPAAPNILIQAVSGQSTKILQLQNASGGDIFTIDPSGNMLIAGQIKSPSGEDVVLNTNNAGDSVFIAINSGSKVIVSNTEILSYVDLRFSTSAIITKVAEINNTGDILIQGPTGSLSNILFKIQNTSRLNIADTIDVFGTQIKNAKIITGQTGQDVTLATYTEAGRKISFKTNNTERGYFSDTGFYTALIHNLSGVYLNPSVDAGQKFQVTVGGYNTMIVDETGVGLVNVNPTCALDIASDKIRLRTAKTPASASAAGNTGDWCWDSDFIYVCIATNTWKKVPIQTW